MTERWHGTAGGYCNHACRCQPCRTAWAAYKRAYRQRRAAARTIAGKNESRPA